MKYKAVVFDLDQTLTEYISWNRITEEIGASIERHNQVFADYSDRKMALDQAIKAIVDLWEKTGKAKRAYFLSLFSGWKLRTEAEDIIKYLKEKGYKIVIISGGLDIYVESIAHKLEIEDFYSYSQTQWDKEGNFISFLYPIDEAEAKYKFFEDFKNKHKLKDEECVVVGDGGNDRRLIENLGYSFLIKSKSNADLAQIADKVIENLNEITHIL